MILTRKIHFKSPYRLRTKWMILKILFNSSELEFNELLRRVLTIALIRIDLRAARSIHNPMSMID
jgi:hypothetical protein